MTPEDIDFRRDGDARLNTRCLRLLVQVNRRARRRSAEPAAYASAISLYRRCLEEIARRRDLRGIS